MRKCLILFWCLCPTVLGSCSDPDSGSCRTTGNADMGLVTSCAEYTSGVSDELIAACNSSTGSVWSEGPCDTTNHCGYCESTVPGGTNGRTYQFDTEGLEDSEAEAEEGCLAGSSTTWVDNEAVTCE